MAPHDLVGPMLILTNQTKCVKMYAASIHLFYIVRFKYLSIWWKDLCLIGKMLEND